MTTESDLVKKIAKKSASEESLFNLAELKTTGMKAGEIIAVDPQLLEKFMTHLSRTVKRDYATKNMVFLAGISAYTKNPINLFLRGESSVGKSYNTTQTLRYFPAEDVLMLGGLSPTALVHDYGMLVDEHGEEIDFNEKPGKDASEEEKKHWREKLQRARYIVDLNRKILVFLEAPHLKTYNKLRPILSHDKEEISYKFTDKTERGRLRTTHVVVKGWPATIFCTTDEKYVKDLATRGFTITPEIGSEKFKEAIALTGEKKALPWKFRDDFDFMLLQGYIRWLRTKLESLNIAIPYARELAEHYPSVYARSMRDYDHFTALIEISALFHYAQRPALLIKHERPILNLREDGDVVTEEEYTILATKKDFYYVLNLWEHVEETTVTGLPGHILDFFHKVEECLDGQNLTYEELAQKYNDASTEKRSSDTIARWIKPLKEIGWLDTEPDPIDKRRRLVRKIKKAENSGYYRMREFPASFKLENFKKWFEDIEKIPAHSQILLKENLIANENASACLEDIYAKHFCADNFLKPSEAEAEYKIKKEPENIGFRQSPTIPELSIGEVLEKMREQWRGGTQESFVELAVQLGLSQAKVETLFNYLAGKELFMDGGGYWKWIK